MHWHISVKISAIEHAEKSLRLSPRERVGWTQLIIGAAHFYSRRFEEAVPKFLLAMQEDPSATDGYRALAACYAHMGRIDEAREVIARLHHYPSGNAEPHPLEQSRAPRALSVGVTLGSRRGDIDLTLAR